MAHRRRAVTPEQFQIVRKAVASTADVASTGKLAPLQGEVASAIHDMFPPKKKKPGAEELETTPQLPTTGSEATAPMSAAKSKEKSMQKVARKKVDPDSVEGRALSAYVQMMMDEEDDEEDVEKRVDQPRDADGKFAPEGSGSDTADHANPFIKPSGKPSPLASAPKADHAAYHAGELVHYLKQQIAA